MCVSKGIPKAFPNDAIYSTNASKAGNGDFPEVYVFGKSLLYTSNAAYCETS